jgi:hypothetical protein
MPEMPPTPPPEPRGLKSQLNGTRLPIGLGKNSPFATLRRYPEPIAKWPYSVIFRETEQNRTAQKMADAPIYPFLVQGAACCQQFSAFEPTPVTPWRIL